MFSFIFVISRGLFEYMRTCADYLSLVYICIAIWDPDEAELDPIDWFNFVTFCACPKPGSGFSTPYVMVFFVFSDLLWEVIVRLEDISNHTWTLYNSINIKKINNQFSPPFIVKTVLRFLGCKKINTMFFVKAL